MKQYKKRWQLKNLAKDKLTGHYSEAVLLTTVYGLFMIADYVINLIVMSTSSDSQGLLMRILSMETTPSGYLLSLGVSLLTSVLLGVLSVGISLFYLNMACGESFSVGNIFHAFKENPNKFLLLALVQTLIQFFFSLPGFACNYFYLLNPSTQWMLLYYICSIAGQLASYPLILGLSQSYRMLLDYPSMSAAGALKKSWQIMKGHKARLFVLTFSFLPLEIAAICTFFIGYLWLSPYIHMTYTLFYLELMQAE